MRKLGLIAAGVALTVAGIAAPVRAQEAQTLLEVAAGNPDFSTLVAAVQAADPSIAEALGNTETQLTVFAPTNAAFEALLTSLNLTAEQLLAEKEVLTTVLAYHVVPGGLTASGLTQANGWYIGTALGDQGVNADGFPIGAFQLTNTTITTSSGSKSTIVTPDVAASNGVIHIVNSVLVPADYAAIASGMSSSMATSEATTDGAMMATSEAATADATEAMMATAEPSMDGTMEAGMGGSLSIAEIVASTAQSGEPKEFTTLLAAVQAADPVIATELTVGGPYTVFAPTDAAFTTALTALNITAEALLGDQPRLTTILSYHVVPGSFSAATLSAAAAKGTIYLATQNNGTAIAVTVADGQVKVDNATVIAADVKASNGVAHGIDGVLLPPG